MTKNSQLYSWGSNLQCQLGKKLISPTSFGQGSSGAGGVQVYSSVPVHITAYEQSMPIQISCGAYHNIILSRALPKAEHPSFENQIVTFYGLVGEAQTQKNNQQIVIHEHRDEDCPNSEQMKKLKSEIKRLRQELIMKPNSKKRGQDDADNTNLEEGFSEEEKQAIKMLNVD